MTPEHHDRQKKSDDSSSRERRQKKRRLGKERRHQARWDMNSPIRRRSPGRRALDRLLNALGLLRK